MIPSARYRGAGRQLKKLLSPAGQMYHLFMFYCKLYSCTIYSYVAILFLDNSTIWKELKKNRIYDHQCKNVTIISVRVSIAILDPYNINSQKF